MSQPLSKSLIHEAHSLDINRMKDVKMLKRAGNTTKSSTAVAFRKLYLLQQTLRTNNRDKIYLSSYLHI